jgi:hypothetical protein
VILGFTVNVDQSGRSLGTPKKLVLALQISPDCNFMFFLETEKLFLMATVPHGHLFLMATCSSWPLVTPPRYRYSCVCVYTHTQLHDLE